MPAAIASFVPALSTLQVDAARSHLPRSACVGSTPPAHATSTSDRHPPTPASSATSSIRDASQLPDTQAPRLKPYASTRPSPSPEQLLDLSKVEPFNKIRFLTVPNRCEPMTQDFTTESAQDWTEFRAACTALFGADFEPAEPFADIRLMMKREERFSHSVSSRSNDKRHGSLPTWLRSELVAQMLAITANLNVKRDLIYQAIAYLDMVLARSINIPREAHWELIFACLYMADDAKNDHYFYDKGKFVIRAIARCQQNELQYKYDGDIFSEATRDQLLLALVRQSSWNLHCDSLYDWVMLYLRNYSALLHEDAAEFRQDKTPSLYFRVLTSAFLLMDYAAMSEELSALPYSVVAAGIVKAVTEDLEHPDDRVVNASLRYTGYTDEQMKLVSQCLHGDPNLAEFYNIESDSKDIYEHSTWYMPDENDVAQVEDESKWSLPHRGYEADLPAAPPALFAGLALRPAATEPLDWSGFPDAWRCLQVAEAVVVDDALEEEPALFEVGPDTELDWSDIPSEEELAASWAEFVASDRYINDPDILLL
ncbi:hypothetical protein HDU81_006643 [Chytriomyces hyalinus]|nr:hypothetical protein HDU81_006643 [Chytriomyces hyalinus]